MAKTVQLVLFDLDGSVFHSYDAEVVDETPDTVVVRVPDHDVDYLETYSKKDGQCLDDRCPNDPHYIMMAAQEPLKNSFVHLLASWWQS